MNKENLNTPKRVWVNSPSTLQPYHELHGRIGIAVLIKDEVRIYFTEGSVHNQQIDPLYLSEKH